jgi:hypothetical protein
VRLILAFQVFFAVLFGRTLPQRLLPAPAEPDDKRQERERLAREAGELKQQVEDLKKEAADARQARDALDREREALKREKAEAEARVAEARAEAEKTQARVDEARAARERAEQKLGEARDQGALSLLSWLQRSGRFIDFVMEEVDSYSDEQVGAAARDIHRGCRKVLDEALGLEPILTGDESAPVQVPPGFDPVSIQLTGNVRGDPPFSGTLMHHGWRTTKVHVPVSETLDARVLAPAEVEL